MKLFIFSKTNMIVASMRNACRRRFENIASFLAVISLVGLSGCKQSGGTTRYETASATRGDIVQHVTASGTLSAVVSVDVGSQVSGKISALKEIGRAHV